MANRSLGTLTLDLVAKIGGFTQSMNQAAQVVDNRMKSIQDSADKAKKALGSVFALTVGGLTAKGLIDMADQYGQMASRIKMVTASTDEYNQVQQRLLQTANITFRPLQEAQEVYIRTSDAIKSLGYNTDQALSITDSFSYLLVTNSASADKANTAINALSKSIETGKVNAESWTTILTTTPSIVNSISESSGMATDAVRKLGAEGKLSLDILVKALLDTEQQNKKLAENMPTTVGDALTKLKNNVTALVGEQNRAYGVTATLADAIGLLANNLDSLAAVAFVGLAAKAGIMARSFALSTVATVSDTKAAIENSLARRADAAATVTATQSLLANIAAEKAFIVTTQQSLTAQLAAANTEAARNVIRQQMKANAAQLVAVTNAEAAATTRLAAAQTAAAGIGRSLLGVLGGPVGIGLTVASVAAGWLMYRSNAEQAQRINIDLSQSSEELNNKLQEMNKNQLIMSIDEIKRQGTEAVRAVDDVYAQLRDAATKASPGSQFKLDSLFSEYKNGERDISSLVDSYIQFSGVNKNAQQQVRQLSDELDKNFKQYQKTNDSLIEVKKRLDEASNSADGARKSFQDVLSISPEQEKNYNRIIDNIKTRILSLQDPTGMESLKKSLKDNNVAEGSDKWKEAIAYQQQAIDLEKQRNQLKSSTKTVDDVAKAYKSQSDQLTQQIALYGQTSEAAKMRYELANGELKVLSDTEKQLLINKSIEIDQLNARKEFDSLMKELRTNEEKARDTLAERVALLDKANIKGKEYVDAMAKISKATVSEAPKFGGIDASVGGASGELIKVAESQKELDKWRAKELEQQQSFLDQKLIAEEDYANNVIEINKRTAKSQEQLNSAWQIATLGTFSTVTGDVADMFKELSGESSAAYKIMFAASKAASIAQAIISTEVAANKAMEMGPILGIPAATAVRALGYASVGMIAATSIAGMAHSGIDNIPEEGTWLLDKGERVLSPRQNSDLTKFLNNTQNSGIATANVAPQVNITINQDGSGGVSSSDGYENMGKQMFEQIRQITRSTIIQEKNKGGVLDPNNRRTG